MRVCIGKYEFTELWDGVFYKALSDWPRVTDNEMKDLIDFLNYEKANGRETVIEADEPQILGYVRAEIGHPEKYENIGRPEIIRECTACPTRGGCMTDLVCHTASAENAESIFRCGALLSAVHARGLPDTVLQQEPRNAAKDPADFFHYVMFAWGNCQAGDRLVMERKLGRSPEASELGEGFTPGVRFYIRYDKLQKHPKAVHDGFLPIKVRDSVNLEEWVDTVVIPDLYRTQLEPLIPDDIADKIHYLSHAGMDVWQWSEKVYTYVHSLYR